MLDLIPDTCSSHFVGKRRGHHSSSQAIINNLLVEMAKEHKYVVRLKGGDPFLFGRGAEEASFLASRGVSVEVVPGITAGISVPAYFGIPLTHRLAGSSVTFVTGHEVTGKERPVVDWRALARATDGLVVYMGVHNLEYIVQELLAGGLDPQTPAAVIQQGTVVGQRYIKTSLDGLIEQVQSHRFLSPSIVVIGDVLNYQVESCAPNPAKVVFPPVVE